ncbi:MAG: pilus assembly protein [Luteimonas sp.]
MTEYIIIVALIAIASITVVSMFGGTVRNQIGGMAQELSGQSATESIQAAQADADLAKGDAQVDRNLGSYDNEVSN